MPKFLTSLFGTNKTLVRPLVFTFLGCLAASLLGGFIYDTTDIRPTAVFLASGVSVASFILGGYPVWPAVALAVGLGSFINNPDMPWYTHSFAILGHVLFPITALYFLQWRKFNPLMANIRDMSSMLVVGLFISIIVPSFGVLSRMLRNTITGSDLPINFGTWWVGIALSVLIITPFILSLALRSIHLKRISLLQYIERAALFLAMIVTTVVLFGTPYTSIMGISLIFVLFAIIGLIALRHGIGVTTATLFTMTIISFFATIFGTYEMPEGGLAARMFAAQVFDLLLVVFFFILASVEEQRRVAVDKLTFQAKQLEEALHRINVENKAKNEFLATLAHELRNPLALFSYSVELLKIEHSGPSPMRQLLDTMEDRVKTMGRLLDDLLDIARIAEKKFGLQKEMGDVNTIAIRAIANVTPSIQTRGHNLVRNFPDGKVMIPVDPIRIEQILQNLLDNAAKYTPPGGLIELSISEENNYGVIRVKDNGIGIPQHMLDEVFEPFVRIGTKRTGGIGIGLSLSKKLAEMHGGTIEAASTGIGQGSTFTVRLPTGLVEHKTPQISLFSRKFINERRGLSQKRITDMRGLRILVVDDEMSIADGLRKLLEQRGHTVQVAYSGKKAIETAYSRIPDVVFLDIGLPDISGYEVARTLRDRNMMSYFIALTGFGQPEDKQKASQAGFDHHLTKPTGIDDIQKVLEQIPAYRLA